MHKTGEGYSSGYYVKMIGNEGSSAQTGEILGSMHFSTEIERSLISHRTKEALTRKKSEGQKLGRPKGSLPKNTKLSGKEEQIRELLDQKKSKL